MASVAGVLIKYDSAEQQASTQSKRSVYGICKLSSNGTPFVRRRRRRRRKGLFKADAVNEEEEEGRFIQS